LKEKPIKKSNKARSFANKKSFYVTGVREKDQEFKTNVNSNSSDSITKLSEASDQSDKSEDENFNRGKNKM